MNKHVKYITKADTKNPIIIPLSISEKILYATGEKFISMGYKYRFKGLLTLGKNIEYNIAKKYVPNDYCVSYIMGKNTFMIFGVYENT